MDHQTRPYPEVEDEDMGLTCDLNIQDGDLANLQKAQNDLKKVKNPTIAQVA